MSHPTSGTSSLPPCLPPLCDLLFSVWFAAEGQIPNFGWLKLYSWLLEILRISWWKGELPLPHLFYDNKKNNQSLEHSWDKFLKCQSANIASLKQNQKPAVSSDCTQENRSSHGSVPLVTFLSLAHRRVLSLLQMPWVPRGLVSFLC